MMKFSILACAACLALTSCATLADEPVQAAAVASPEAIKGVHHVGITVSDIDDTIAFYSSAVPYELVERRRVPAAIFPDEVMDRREGEVEIALIRTPTVFLQLIDIDPQTKSPGEKRPVIGPGYTHICFQSPSNAPKYDRFKEIGLEMLSRGDTAVDIGGYGVTYAYGFDPDGIMIEMEQLDPMVIASQGELGRKRSEHPAWPTHVANVPGDKPRMVDFYTTVLGYGPRRELEPMSRETLDDVVDIDNIIISASWFEAGNFELEFWHYDRPKTPHTYIERKLDTTGYNSIVFEVTDLDGTVARLTSEGVQFAGQTLELGGWKVRYARDPEGNLLGFQERVSAPAEHSIDDMLWLGDRAPSTPRT